MKIQQATGRKVQTPIMIMFPKPQLSLILEWFNFSSVIYHEACA